MTTIDIAPTPEGMRHSIQLFEEQIKKSEHLIKVAEEWVELVDIERCVYVVPSEFPIFEGALEALQEQERQRIQHMREGIAAASGESTKPTPVPADSWFVDVAVQEYQREGHVDVDTDRPEVSRDAAGAYVKAWVFVEYPGCDASLGIHECVRPVGHDEPHACDSECDLGHLREDDLRVDPRSLAS
jgi:hypothetical protein